MVIPLVPLLGFLLEERVHRDHLTDEVLDLLRRTTTDGDLLAVTVDVDLVASLHGLLRQRLDAVDVVTG